jgi:L-aspartate oxidase
LWACGETSATGVHGANRLASNSLLEALVYGGRVATDVKDASVPPGRLKAASRDAVRQPARLETQAIADLRNVMYANVGLVRNERGLREALLRISELDAHFERAGNELRNLLVVGRLIAEAALARPESRGSHYRCDYPQADEAFAKRSFTRLRTLASS